MSFCSGICCAWVLVAVLSIVAADNAQDDAMGLHVYCTPESIVMVLERRHYPDLDPSSFHLKGDRRNPRCRVNFYNSTHIIIKAPLGSCGTRAAPEGNMLSFTNQVLADISSKSGSSGIARQAAYEFQLRCLYYTTAKISLHSYQANKTVVIKPKTGIGYFPFQISMFQTDKYLSPFESFPVKVHVGERIHLQVKVQTNASNLVILLDNCRATPSKDPNDTTFQVLIKDGCPVTKSLNYKTSESGNQRFSLEAFRFFGNVEDVFVHCEVVVCRKDNSSSRCAKGCRKEPESSGNSRRRRDETEVARNVTSLGPLRILLDRLYVVSPPEEGAARSAASSLQMSAVLLPIFFACLVMIMMQQSIHQGLSSL